MSDAKVRLCVSLKYAYICKCYAHIDRLHGIKTKNVVQRDFTYREIVYDGKSAIRSTYNSLGTQMDDNTQHGYERYHSHEDYQLMFLEEGKVNITIDEVVHEYSSGDILMLGPQLPHKIEACSGVPCKGILIQFKQNLFPQGMQDIGDYHFISSLLNKSLGGLLFHSDLEQGAFQGGNFSLFSSIHQSSGVQRLCLLLQLLDALGRELQSSTTISHLSEVPEKESLEAVVEKCKRYLKVNYRSDIDLQSLSLLLGANATALCRKFKKNTGETIFQYLIHLRIETACKMLHKSNRSISEIAYHCGFNTLSHFNRKFREIMDMSPMEFRARN